MRVLLLVVCASALSLGCATAVQRHDQATLQQEVVAAERAFARTMAERDHAAFVSFLADEAIFFAGEVPSRGRDSVAAAWRRFFEGERAPFSWEPDRVEVLDSGTLAFSTGPVRDPSGRVIGRFNSIWRREAPGRWRVVFDKGSPLCPAP